MRIRRKLGTQGELSGEQLVALIIILVTTITVMVILVKIKDTVDGEADGLCAAAVVQAHFINKLYGHQHAMEIKGCQTKQLLLERKDFSSDAAKAQVQVQRVLAENMRICWKAWGSGQYDLFNGTGDYCHTCAIITFDKEVQELFPNGKISNFNAFLMTNRAPGGEQTYSEVLLGYASKNSDLSGINNDPFAVDITQPTAILFWYAKEKSQNDALNILLGPDASPLAKASILSGIGAAAPLATAAASASPILVPVTATANLGVTAVIATTVPSASAGVVMASIAALPTAGLVIGTVFVGGYLYTRYGGGDDYAVLSATYILPHRADSYYGQQCTSAASTPVSP